MVTAREFGDELLQKLLTYALDTIPGALGTGLSLATDGGDEKGGAVPHSVAAIGLAAELDMAQWRQGVGPIWEAFRTGRLVVAPSAASDPTPPEGPLFANAQAAAEAHRHDGAHDREDASPLAGLGMQQVTGLTDEVVDPLGGAVFLTGEWGGDLPVVLSVYLDRVPDREVLQSIDKVEPMVTHALAVVEYCSGEEMLAQQMLEMNQYRRVIEQAKGLVIGATGSDGNNAFATLARASQHFNVRLRNLAVALVEHVSGAEAEHPDDPALVIDPSRRDRVTAAKVWAALNAASILDGVTGTDPVLDHTGTGSIPRIDG